MEFRRRGLIRQLHGLYRGPTTNPNQNTGTQGAYGTATTTISSANQMVL